MRKCLAGTVLALSLLVSTPAAILAGGDSDSNSDSDDTTQTLAEIQAQIDDLQAQIDALGGGAAGSLLMATGVSRSFDVNCPGDYSLGGLFLGANGTAQVPGLAPLSFTSPDPVFGSLASLSSSSWVQVEGQWGASFTPAGCLGPADPASDVATEELRACALAEDGTHACVGASLCSGDCLAFIGIPAGFTGHPWIFVADLIP